jgi:hypothetical protein
VFDNALNRAVLFDGATSAGVLNDTWLWDGGNWTAATTSSPPTARSAAAASYDPVGQHLVVYGGGTATGTALDDTTLLSLQSPITLTPTTPSTSGSGASTQTVTAPTTGGHPATTKANASHPSASTTVPVSTLTSTTQLTPQSSPSLAVTVKTAHRGELVQLSASGFKPGALVTITFHSQPFQVGTAHADRYGVFVATVAVPEGAPYGMHHFVAAGENPLGQMREASTPIQIDGVPVIGGKSASRAVTAAMVGIAIALPFVTWTALSLRSRWRQRSAAKASN